MDNRPDRLQFVLSQIADAVAKSGRHAAEVELVAVSKTHDPEAIREVAAAGQTAFGESRVQEAKAKIPLLPARLQWHFIGHLQKNKIRAALGSFELFHGVDSLEVAGQVQRIAGEEAQRARVLLEVNVAGESTKFGFPLGKLEEQIEDLLAFDRLDIVGLMTMAPLAPEAEHSRRYFAQLRELRDRLATRAGVGLPHLSMGMSGDYVVGVEEGATLVRVGSAIFGERSGKKWEPAS